MPLVRCETTGPTRIVGTALSRATQRGVGRRWLARRHRPAELGILDEPAVFTTGPDATARIDASERAA